MEEQGKKQIDLAINQRKRLAALTNKNDGHKDNYQKIFKEHIEKNKILWNKARRSKHLQNVFKSNLNEVSTGRHKSEEQKNVLKNIKLLYESWEAVIKLFNDYSSIVPEAKYKWIHAKRLKILTPKQMLQKLPIAFPQVKAGNTSDKLLNEIRQIIYSLYQANH